MKPISQLTTIDKLLARLAPLVILVAAVLVIFSIKQNAETKYAVKETAAYTRVSNCIVAKVANPPTTQEDVEKCYTQVEKDSEINLERFDFQTNNENPKK